MSKAKSNPLVVVIFLFVIFVADSFNSAHASTNAQDGFIWLGTDKGLLRVDLGASNTVTEFGNLKHVTGIAVDNVGGLVWAYSSKLLQALTTDGDEIVSFSPRAEKHVGLAANPHDGSVWLASNKELRGYGLDGQLISRFAIKSDAKTLSFYAPDSLLFLAYKHNIQVYDIGSDRGSQVNTMKLPDVEHLAVDDTFGYLWAATKGSILKLNLQGKILAQSTRKGINHLASDQGGGLWLATDDSVVRLDESLEVAFQLGGFKGSEKVVALEVDPVDHSGWIVSSRYLRQIGPDGQILYELRIKTAGVNSKIHMLGISRNRDFDFPELTFINPTLGGSASRTPVIDLAYSDIGSGIAPSSFRLLLNNVDVTAGTQLSTTGAIYAVTADLPLGPNTAVASVSDRAGNSVTVSNQFNVSAFRAIPDCLPTSGNAPLQVRFRTRAEFSGGSIVRYRWDFQGDGTYDTFDPVARDYSFTFTSAGTFNAVLEVMNNLGDVATARCVIHVQGSNPTASANAVPSNGEVPLTVNFNCVANDPDGSITLFEWDFNGDGTFEFNSPSPTATFTYTQPGTFNAVCRVTDNDGNRATARTSTTVIRTGGPGTPSVNATASPGTGNAPLNVAFNGTATDNGTIVLWEWDFDGDGSYEYSSASSPAVSRTYTNAGIFAAALRVTDNNGLRSIDNVEIIVNLIATLAVSDDTFDPSMGEMTEVRTTINAPAPVRLILKNGAGNIVRTLVNTTRGAGAYADVWDGRDDAGQLLPQAPYYAVLEYQVGGDTRQVDLTATTGGQRYNPSRNSLPRIFRPFEDDLLTINFTIPAGQGASEIQAFIGLFYIDTRLVTLLERVPLGVGTHTIKWDGVDANGNFAVPPPGDQFLFGIFGFTLPDNAIFVQSAPVMSNLSLEPNFFDPSTGDFLSPTNPTTTATFDLDRPANIELTVTSLKTGKALRKFTTLNVPGGTSRSVSWDGRADNGIFVDKGDYRLSLRAIDYSGSESLKRYALVRVFY